MIEWQHKSNVRSGGFFRIEDTGALVLAERKELAQQYMKDRLQSQKTEERRPKDAGGVGRL